MKIPEGVALGEQIRMYAIWMADQSGYSSSTSQFIRVAAQIEDFIINGKPADPDKTKAAT